MNSGKDICNELKALRRRIADENQIPLETEECTYKGECCGTCPRCDAEVRYLEDALSHRLSLGKAATVAGLALGLAVGVGVQAQNVTDTAALKPVAKEISDTVGKVRVTGVVKDSVTNEPEPFVNVTLNKDGKIIAGCATNLNGEFTIWAPCKDFGKYEIKVRAIGFKDVRIPIKWDGLETVIKIGDVFIEGQAKNSIRKIEINKGFISPSVNTDWINSYYVDGVKVIVK